MPSLAFVGPSLGLRWACVGLRWPSLAGVGCCGIFLAFLCLRWPATALRWPAWPALVVVDLWWCQVVVVELRDVVPDGGDATSIISNSAPLGARLLNIF
jgi:hypothetical protein